MIGFDKLLKEKEIFMTTLYDFKAKTINGKEESLDKYKGKVSLVVNVASKCGFTNQYKGLQELYEKYHNQGFEILGFPSNDFGAQEPGSEEEIKNFCSLNYNVTFDMFAKVPVKGENKVDIYQYLTSPETNKSGAGEVKWNFQKYLVDKQGNIVRTYPSNVEPLDQGLRNDIEGLLKK
jgi:glutathione peroxidase